MTWTQQIFQVLSYKKTQKIFEVYYPSEINNEINSLHKKHGGQLFFLKTSNKHNSYNNDCHNNVGRYINNYGGNEVLCFYMLCGKSGGLSLIRHSIIKQDDKYVDVTPSNINMLLIYIPTHKFLLNYKSIEVIDGKINLVK